MKDNDKYLDDIPGKTRYSNVWEKLFNWARSKSLWIVTYGTGCGAIEIPPMLTSRFDAERFGISAVGTPRQADVLIISGYLTVKTLKRVIRIYEQMQSPKYVVALGACTVNGGMYFDSYNTVNLVDKYIPIDVYVAGCMPRPEAILAGFAQLMEKIKADRADGWKQYREKFKAYREEQKKIIKNWKMPDYNW